MKLGIIYAELLNFEPEDGQIVETTYFNRKLTCEVVAKASNFTNLYFLRVKAIN